DVDGDELPDKLRPLRGQVDRIAPAHRQPDEDDRGEPELLDHTGDVVEGDGGVVDVRRVTVPVPALVQGVDVEVRLQRDAEGVPGVRVSREAVEQEEWGAVLASPVEHVQLQIFHDALAIDRSQEVHGGAQDTRISTGGNRFAKIARIW